MTELIFNGIKTDATNLHSQYDDFANVESVEEYAVLPASRSNEFLKTLKIGPDDVVEIEFEDGIVDFLDEQALLGQAADPKRKGIFRKKNRDDSGEQVLLDDFIETETSTRTLGKLVIKFVRRIVKKKGLQIGVRLAAEHLDKKHTPEERLFVFKSAEEQPATLITAASKLDHAPHLLLIHGFASTVGDSFRAFRESGNEAFALLNQTYHGHILGYDHHTLTRSALENAVDLARRLPKNLTVDILSFSRGGLVAEILVKAAETDMDNPDEMAFWTDAAERLDGHPDAPHFATLLTEVKDKNLKVRNFVRSGCPAGGTTLASQRLVTYLKVVLNAFRFIPGVGGNPFYEGLKNLIIAVVKEKDNADVLPGVQAMNPASEFVKTINHLGVVYPITRTPLHVVAGDVKFGSFWHSMKVVFTDVFFLRDHDFVVDTISMHQGFRRSIGSEAEGTLKEGFYRFFHRHGEVSHFRYLYNDDSARAIVAALRQESVSAHFEWYDYGAADEAFTRMRAHDPKRPTVIIIPGIMGSHLKAGKNRVWLHFPRLVVGGMAKLNAGARDVSADGAIGMYYGKLASHLSNTHNVEMHGFDWRSDLLDSADLLKKEVEDALANTSGAVRIVAHSMGGLLTHALYSKHPDTWEKLRERSGFRCVFMGTPFRGSHSIVNLYLKRHSTFNLLHKIDLINNSNQMLKIINEFVGMLQLLPHESSFFADQFWLQMRNASPDGATFTIPASASLSRAHAAVSMFGAKRIEGEELIYVAGFDEAGTPSRVEVNTLLGAVKVFCTTEGDGAVTWQTGILEQFQDRVWYTRIKHQNLCNKKSAFSGVLELLEKGTTQNSEFSAFKPATQRGAVEFEMIDDQAELPMVNNERDLLGIPDDEETTTVGPAPQPVRIKVKHSNLAYASYPLVVGHFEGDDIIGAEAQIDCQLEGELERQHELGYYPGKIGDTLVVIRKNGYFKGVVVVGLGFNERLTENTLERTLTRGFIELALQGNRCSCSKDSGEKTYGISPLLVGSAYAGMDVTESLKAMMRATMKVNEQLTSSVYPDLQPFTEIEIVELYLDKSIEVSKALLRLVNDHEFSGRFTIEPYVDSGSGGLSRVGEGWQPTWWHRLQITEEVNFVLPAGEAISEHSTTVTAGVKRYMKYVSLSDKARAEVEVHDLDRGLVKIMLAQSVKSTANDPALSKVLFELLMPLAFKGYAHDVHNVNLILDEASAQYPWELISSSGKASVLPLAVRSGLIRQLHDANYRPNVYYPSDMNVLVIGDPECTPPFRQLAFAKKEAQMLAQRMAAAGGMKVELSLGQKAVDVMKKLVMNEYRIIHLAGHGDFDEHNVKRSGMVMSDGTFLNPTVIGNLTYVPELVFVNCCYLGAIGDTSTLREHTPWNRLAANLGTQFIRNGVKAVIAAGWAVDDVAAETFADVFYSNLFAGDDFGTAVQKARMQCYHQFPHTNTWGAYQCYGNPHYRLMRNGRRISMTIPNFVHKAELLSALNNLGAASDERCGPTTDETKGAIAQLLVRGERWTSQGDVLEAAANCYFEVECDDLALDYFERAVECTPHDFSYRSRINMIKLLVKLAKRRRSDGSIDAAKYKAMLAAAEEQVQIINTSGKRVSSLTEVGGHYKRLVRQVGDAPALLENAVRSAHYYHEAYVLSKHTSLYALTNYLQLAAILHLHKPEGGEELPVPYSFSTRTAKAALDDAFEWIENNRTSLSDFWSTLFEADLIIAEVIAGPRLTMAESSAKIDSAFEVIAHTFRRSGSLRKREVILEHYRFLKWLLANVNDSATAGKARIRQLDKVLALLLLKLESLQT